MNHITWTLCRLHGFHLPHHCHCTHTLSPLEEKIQVKKKILSKTFFMFSHFIFSPFSPLFLRVRSIWSLSWIRTWRSVGWSLMKECLSNCSVDGRLGYVFTRQPSMKSMNFLDLEQKRGKMIRKLEKRERWNRRQLAAGALNMPTH